MMKLLVLDEVQTFQRSVAQRAFNRPKFQLVSRPFVWHDFFVVAVRSSPSSSAQCSSRQRVRMR